jgi:phosphoserine aminotransferase
MTLSISKELYPSDPRFGVGPSLIPVEFIQNLEKTGHELLGTSHRKMPVRNLVKSVQDGFREYFSLPSGYEVVIGNGGASFLFDMIGLGLVKNKSAHFVCGEFSKKWYLAHKNIPWIETELFEVPFGEGINPHDVEEVDMICTTLNETSTGVIINSIPDLRGTEKLLAVDATSGGGQVLIDMEKVDIFFLSPQKVLASEGGTYVAILSPRAIERIEDVNRLNRYIPNIMDWQASLDNAKKNQTLNTPSITSIFYLNEQLKLMNALGAKEVEKQAKEKANLLYSWANEKPYLSPYVKEEEFQSHAVAVINVDDKFSADKLVSFLSENKIAYDIGGYRKLGLNQLRIGLFHNIKIADLKKLIHIIDLYIAAQ